MWLGCSAEAWGTENLCRGHVQKLDDVMDDFPGTVLLAAEGFGWKTVSALLRRILEDVHYAGSYVQGPIGDNGPNREHSLANQIWEMLLAKPENGAHAMIYFVTSGRLPISDPYHEFYMRLMDPGLRHA